MTPVVSLGNLYANANDGIAPSLLSRWPNVTISNQTLYDQQRTLPGETGSRKCNVDETPHKEAYRRAKSSLHVAVVTDEDVNTSSCTTAQYEIRVHST